MGNHYLANYISILNYALITKRLHCRIYNTSIGERITSLLLEHGYIAGYRIIQSFSCSYIYIQLKEQNNFNPIMKIQLVSKPTNRIYWSYTKLKEQCTRTHNLTQYVLSTPHGFVLSKDAIASHLGGEVLFMIN